VSDGALRLAFGGLSPKAVDKHVDRYGSIDAAVAAITRGRTKLGATVCDAIRVGAQTRADELVGIGATFLESSDDGYPERLGLYSDAPRWLFSMGAPPDGPSIGIV